MWKKINRRFKETLFSFLQISIFVYFSLTNIIPRYRYNFLPEKNSNTLNSVNIASLETNEKCSLRSKLFQDLKYHKILNNWNTKTVTKVTLNNEGKIIGYKIYNRFYPSYFTKTQIKNIIRKSFLTRTEQSSLLTIKLYFHT